MVGRQSNFTWLLEWLCWLNCLFHVITSNSICRIFYVVRSNYVPNKQNLAKRHKTIGNKFRTWRTSNAQTPNRQINWLGNWIVKARYCSFFSLITPVPHTIDPRQKQLIPKEIYTNFFPQGLIIKFQEWPVKLDNLFLFVLGVKDDPKMTNLCMTMWSYKPPSITGREFGYS